jgi:hypothetical protein
VGNLAFEGEDNKKQLIELRNKATGPTPIIDLEEVGAGEF